MALSGSTIWECWSTGSSTLNGGGFDPSQTAGMFTDGAATGATGNSPVFTSASYNFVAGDVGAWVYVASGTNWTPGWYQIASVAANAATLTASVGGAVDKTLRSPNTAAGCATTASPTGATWTIDYSQQAAAQFAYTDLASAGAGLTVSSAASPFAKQQVGNAIVITGGTNFTAGRYVIASVAAGVATVVGPGNITTGAGASGTGGLGGAFATVGGMVALMTITGMSAYVKATATYTISAGITWPSGQSYTGWGRLIGYGTVRGDSTRPTVQASAGSFTMLTLGQQSGTSVENMIWDGNSQTSLRGIDLTGAYNRVAGCKIMNCTNSAVRLNVAYTRMVGTQVTGCATQPAVLVVGDAVVVGCAVHGNTVTGISGTGGNAPSIINCLIYANTGATSDGVKFDYGTQIFRSTIYGNGRDGIRIDAFPGIFECMNNVITGNGGYGINSVTAPSGGNTVAGLIGYNAFHNNTSGARNALGVGVGDVTLAGDPFTNAAGGDFSLNNTAGAGAACRAVAYPGSFPGATTASYADIGAAQHQDSGGGGSVAMPVLGRIVG